MEGERIFMKNKKRLAKLIFVAILLLIIWYTFKDSAGDIVAQLQKTSFAVLVAIMAATVIYHLFEAWITYSLARRYNPKFKFREAVYCAFNCSFYRLSTLGSGSGVAAIVYLGKKGVGYSEATGLYMIQYMVHKVSVALFSGLLFILNWKVMSVNYREYGVYLGTVNIDHATPAAFYAHQASRKNYYDIGVELANSGFEYFAGGEFQKVKGNGNVPDNHAVAAQAGYRVVTSQAEAAALPANAGKTLIIAQNLADGKSMNYAMDAAPGEWQLTDYVKKGIELLDNGKGFFLMTESGKIDWACHANDAAASIHDVLEMSNAVQAAVDFYNRHPNETLILVTADHETGGLAIGYKTTNYDTFLQNLTRQKMSYAKFDAEYVSRYVAEKTPFETAMADVKANFGLTLPNDPDAANAGKLLLTDYEAQQLRDAYQRTLEVGASSQGKMSQLDYERYGTYIPFSMAICHAINHKSGLDHTTYAHTGAPVNLYAMGVGAEQFQGVYDNTEIYHKLAELTKVQ